MERYQRLLEPTQADRHGDLRRREPKATGLRARGHAPLFVTFSGGDLSGKSTQVKLLSSKLRSTGHDVVTLWHRPGYSPRLDRIRSSVRRLRPGALPAADDIHARTQVF